MADEPVHYELFIRKGAQTGWTLDQAGEERPLLLEAAERALKDKRAVGVKVTKETRRSSGEYLSIVIFSRGELEPPRKKGRDDDEAPAPLCVSPADLYTVHARERIARLFESFLRRRNVTAFELLHRPDLVEALDAAGMEIQGAIQKVAIPEARASGASTHDMVRRFQRLADGAVERLLGDERRGVFPDIEREGLGPVLRRVQGAPDAAYLLGVAVAHRLTGVSSWMGKVSRLLDLAEACAPDDPARALLFQVIEQPLSEILGGRAAFLEMLGEKDAVLGRTLALTVSLVMSQEARALLERDAELGRVMPPLNRDAERLARWLAHPALKASASALGRRVLEEMGGSRRLHPEDPTAEILTMRVLARVLVLSPRLASAEAVEGAITARSRGLVSADFVQVYLQQVGGGPLDEAAALLKLGENVVGAANRRAAGEWLKTLLGSHRFEKAMHGDGPAGRLAQLAELQHGLKRIGLEPDDEAALALRLGEIGDTVESESRLVSALGRAHIAALGRLMLLLKLANGETAPIGPVTRRARMEALKLARDPTLRAELAQATPSEMERVRQLLHGAGAAAA